MYNRLKGDTIIIRDNIHFLPNWIIRGNICKKNSVGRIVPTIYRNALFLK